MPETIMNLTSGRAPRLTDPFTDSLLLICRLLVCRGEGRLRLAYAEKDETMDFDPEAQEHLKLDGKRLGRDIRVYGFMGRLSAVGEGTALGCFAEEILAPLKVARPEAFTATLPAIRKLSLFLVEELQQDWVNLWAEEN